MFSYNEIDSAIFNVLNNPFEFSFMSIDPNCAQSPECINVNGNYSLESALFFIKALPGFWLIINMLVITIRDIGKFSSDKYGYDITLVNGINFVNGAKSRPEFNITEGLPIRKNSDWGIYTPNPPYLSNYGTGLVEEVLTIPWSFTESGRPVILDGDVEEYIGMRLHDNFSGLTGHYFHIQGMNVPKN